MPRPFLVDPAVMRRIRPMLAIDIPQVAALHHAAMGESLWARLGLHFLRGLYWGLNNDPRFLGFVYQEEGRVRGFIAGSQDVDAMLRSVFRAQWPALAIAALPSLRHPSVLRRLLETARYSERSGTGIPAESLFCSFEPDLRGRRISGHVNKVLFDELLARGHERVKVTTEVSNLGANRQLQSWGFEDKGRFRFYGKEMVVYVLDLQLSDRVDPVSRHHSV